ncbi:hypothetical protein MMC07_006327 [Pseudocyphellaria aurata]|nr:hypothetical protein [Pseudocyphellaria aurata]
MVTRTASHAGSWYSDHGPTLSKQLDGWLNQVDSTIEGIGNIPQPGARAIIAPHAGYAYSGPAAAWAYKSLDLSKAKRIFLLGPSHHFYLSCCALSQCAQYATPLGPLALDTTLIATLHATSQFTKMSPSTDEDEHSLEMHLPYIYKLLSRSFPSPDLFPPLVPILVGATSPSAERTYGALLAPYLADPSSIFVISSDFCHWGSRFSYTYYLPSSSVAPADGYAIRSSKSKNPAPTDPPIYESIARLDRLSMEAIESGSHDRLVQNLKETGNTVCGRHPIGILMAAMEALRDEGKVGEGQGRCRFVKYERSGDVKEVGESSVSYASAFAIIG